MSKDLQSIFERNLSKIAAEAQTPPTDQDEGDETPIMDIEDNVPIRNFEDFTEDMDGVLKRRLIDAQKFDRSVEEIREAMQKGRFVINVVAPKYKEYKELVDLIVNQAISSPMSQADKTLPPPPEDSDPADKKAAAKKAIVEAEKRRAEIQERRYAEMDGSIILDTSAEIVSRMANKPEDKDNLVSNMCNGSFFGSEMFNPNDVVNCLYNYVEDYVRDPNLEPPEQQLDENGNPVPMDFDYTSSRRTMREVTSPFFSNAREPDKTAGRDPGVFRYEGKEGTTEKVDFSRAHPNTGRPMHRHSLKYDDPAAAPVAKNNELPPDQRRAHSIYFDERAPYAHIRRNPKYESSYLYGDRVGTAKCDEKVGSENGAIERFNKLIDEGFSEEATALRNKWFAFCYILSLLQDDVTKEGQHVRAPLVSVFHAGGFDTDKNPRPNPVTQSTPDVPTSSSDGSAVLSEDLVSEIIAEFLDSIGVHDEDVTDEISSAIMDENIEIEEETSDAVLLDKALKDMTPAEIAEAVSVLAKKALKYNEEQDSNLEDSGGVEAWVEGYHGKFTGIAGRVEQAFHKMLKAQANSESKLVKKAAAPQIAQSPLYKKIQQIVLSHPNIGFSIPSGVGDEYVVDLLIKYISGKTRESEAAFALDDKKRPKNQNTLLGKMDIAPNAVTMIIPFEKRDRAALGIQSEEDLEEVFKVGTKLKISSAKNSHTVTVSEFHVCDQQGEAKAFPSPNEKENSNLAFTTGLHISFNEPSNALYSGDKYTVSLIKHGGMSTSGLSDMMYSYLYGGDKEGKAKRAEHEQSHVEFNLSIYPCWAPSAFDYRKLASVEGVGHANNAYNVRLALEERIALRDSLVRKMSRGPLAELKYKTPIDVLDQEIAEIRYVLYNYALHRYKSYKQTAGVNDRDTSNTMVRAYGNQSRSNFYKEVRQRSLLAGFEIGDFGNLSDMRAVKRILKPDQYQKFLEIVAQVKKEFGRRRSVTIIRGIDDVIPNPGDTNGFMVKTPETEDAQSVLQFTPTFDSNVSILKGNLIAASRDKRLRSHIIIISEAALPPLAGESTQVHIQCSTISKKEIESLIEYYVTTVKKEKDKELKGKEKPVDVSKFGIFQAVVLRMQKKLAGLDFVETRNFIEKTVRELFDEYMNHGDLVKTFLSSELKLNEEMDELRTNWETSTASLLPEGSEIRPARFKLSDYAVKFKSEWAKWLDTRLQPKAAAIEEGNLKLNFFRRALETDCLFGSYVFEKDSEQPMYYVRFSFYDSQPGGKTLVWFTSKDDFFNAEPDRSLVKMAEQAGFSISGNIASVLAKEIRASDEAKKAGQTFTPTEELDGFDKNRNYALAMADDPTLEAEGEYLSRYKSDINISIEKIQASVNKIMSTFPSLLLLHGEPGTGKSIFAEVLATVLDCKFVSSNFQNIAYAGQSNFRGVSETNFRRFTDICRNSEDTIFLIDEIDTFIQNATGATNGDTARALLGILLQAWEDDEGKYRMNNVHIVLTTNQLAVIEEVSSALLSRVRASGGIHKVELPGDASSLANLFTNGSIYNNLMMKMFEGHERLIGSVNELIALYDSDDPTDKEVVKSLKIRLQKQWPEVFAQTPIMLSDSKQKWLVSKGLKTAEDRDQVDPVDDFVKGWKETDKMLLSLNSNVTLKVKGQEQKFNALAVICNKLAEKIFYTSTSPTARDANGEQKQFARTTLREFISILREMMMSHQSFLSGDRGQLPFNWKTFLAVVLGTRYSGLQIRQELAMREGLTEEDWAALIRDPSRDGYKHLLSFSETVGPDGEKIPREFWMTDDQYKSEVARESGYVKAHGVEKDGDGGYNHLSKVVSNSLYFEEPSFEKAMNDMARFVKVAASRSTIPAEDINDFLDEYNALRNDVKGAIYSKNSPKQKLAMLLGSDGSLAELISKFESFSGGFGKIVSGYFGKEGEGKQFNTTYNLFLKKMQELPGVVSVIDAVRGLATGSLYEEKLKGVEEVAKIVFDSVSGPASELFTDAMMQNSDMEESRFQELKRGMEEKRYKKGVKPKVKTFNPYDAYKKPEEKAKETPPKPGAEPVAPETEEPIVQPVITPPVAKPPATPPAAVGTAPEVGQPKEVPPVKETPGKKSKVTPIGGFGSTTDYYAKIAQDALEVEKQRLAEAKPKTVKKALQMNPAPVSQDPCADLLMNYDFSKIIETQDNKDRFTAQREKGIYDEKRLNNLEIWRFF